MSQAKLQPNQLTGEQLVEFIEFQQRPPPAAPSTINRRLRLLQRFVDFLTGTPPIVQPWEYRSHAASFYARTRRGSLRLKEPHRVVHPLKDAEVLEFFSSLKTWRDRAITLLMWAEGLRSAEVLDLTIPDLDFHHSSLRIQGKGNKERMMPLAEPVANALVLYLRLERPGVSSPRLFLVLKPPRRGRALTLGGLRAIFRYHRKTSGVHTANPHRFRHAFGTNMTRYRTPLLALAKMMGHSSPNTTIRYVEIEDAELRALYLEAIEKLLPGDLIDE
jgi:site-specific recombinase XerD